MPEWAAWLGWIIGIVSFFVNILQLVRNRAYHQNVRAVKGNLQSVSDVCNQALKEGTFKSPDAMQQLLKDIGQFTVGAKRSLDTLLPPKPPRDQRELSD